jgi:hypothetical protein
MDKKLTKNQKNYLLVKRIFAAEERAACGAHSYCRSPLKKVATPI